jgi:hypothetical protein
LQRPRRSDDRFVAVVEVHLCVKICTFAGLGLATAAA